MTPRIVTYSELQCADTCLRKHKILYGLKLRRAKQEKALRIGTAIHKALDLHATGWPVAHAIMCVREDYAAYEPSLSVDEALHVAYEHEMVAQVLACYFWYWEAENAQIKCIESEMQFAIPIRNPKTNRAISTKYAGKIDKLAVVDGLLSIIEHKTTSQDISPDSDYFKRLRIDAQIGNYFAAARTLGHDVQQIIYDVIRKPGLRPTNIPLLDDDGIKIVLDANGERVRNKDGKTWRQTSSEELGYVLQTRVETPAEFGERIRNDIASRPEYYFTRRTIGRIDADVAESEQALFDKAKRLDYHRNINSWPRNTGACIGFGRCACFDLCTNSFDPDAGIVPDGWERVDNQHTELEPTE